MLDFDIFEDVGPEIEDQRHALLAVERVLGLGMTVRAADMFRMTVHGIGPDTAVRLWPKTPAKPYHFTFLVTVDRDLDPAEAKRVCRECLSAFHRKGSASSYRGDRNETVCILAVKGKRRMYVGTSRSVCEVGTDSASVQHLGTPNWLNVADQNS